MEVLLFALVGWLVVGVGSRSDCYLRRVLVRWELAPSGSCSPIGAGSPIKSVLVGVLVVCGCCLLVAYC